MPKKNKITLIAGYQLPNNEKLNRAIYGSEINGEMKGGVGKDASEEAVLAEYDRLAGLILDADGDKVETGSFWDFKNKQPQQTAKAKKAQAPKRGGLKEVQVGDKDAKKGKNQDDEEEEADEKEE